MTGQLTDGGLSALKIKTIHNDNVFKPFLCTQYPSDRRCPPYSASQVVDDREITLSFIPVPGRFFNRKPSEASQGACTDP
jgi:hypothetical protein